MRVCVICMHTYIIQIQFKKLATVLYFRICVVIEIKKNSPKNFPHPNSKVIGSNSQCSVQLKLYR